MGESDEATELRALQAKAFGRDGAVSADDLVRLRELQERRLSAELPSADAAAGAAESAQPQSNDDAGEESNPSIPAPPKGRSRLSAGSLALAVAALIIGVLGGAAGGAFGLQQIIADRASAEMPPGAELLDDGSIEYLGTIRGAKLWTATQDDGAGRCVILSDVNDFGGWTTSSCQESSSREPLVVLAQGLSEGTAREYTVAVDAEGEESVIYRTIDSPFPE